MNDSGTTKKKIDQLLQYIDPDMVIDGTFARLDNAMNTLPMKPSRITDWEEYRVYMAGFFYHVENVILNCCSTRKFDPVWDWRRCYPFIVTEFGKNGEKAAFEIARTGVEGGLYSVIRKVGKRIAEHYVEAEIKSKVLYFWNELSVEEKFNVQSEYLTQFAHLFPSELTEGCAARIRADFVKTLQEHPKMVHRLRQIGR